MNGARVINQASFVVRPLSAESMDEIGEQMVETITGRLHRGLNAQDNPAIPLKPGLRRGGYPDRKRAKGLQAIRDWFWTGNTIGSMAVIESAENASTIGFSNPIADLMANLNNKIEIAFAVSPDDREQLVSDFIAESQQARIVGVETEDAK